MTQHSELATWAADPELVAAAIQGLVTSVFWLCGIIGSGCMIAVALVLFIDGQRMKRWDKIELNIETIAQAMTSDKLKLESRLTHLETLASGFASSISSLFKILGRGERHEDGGN